MEEYTRREYQYFAKELNLCRGNAKTEDIKEALTSYMQSYPDTNLQSLVHAMPPPSTTKGRPASTKKNVMTPKSTARMLRSARKDVSSEMNLEFVKEEDEVNVMQMLSFESSPQKDMMDMTDKENDNDNVKMALEMKDDNVVSTEAMEEKEMDENVNGIQEHEMKAHAKEDKNTHAKEDIMHEKEEAIQDDDMMVPPQADDIMDDDDEGYGTEEFEKELEDFVEEETKKETANISEFEIAEDNEDYVAQVDAILAQVDAEAAVVEEVLHEVDVEADMVEAFLPTAENLVEDIVMEESVVETPEMNIEASVACEDLSMVDDNVAMVANDVEVDKSMVADDVAMENEEEVHVEQVYEEVHDNSMISDASMSSDSESEHVTIDETPTAPSMSSIIEPEDEDAMDTTTNTPEKNINKTTCMDKIECPVESLTISINALQIEETAAIVEMVTSHQHLYFLPNGRAKCVLTGHEMKPLKHDIAVYLSGKRYRAAALENFEDFTPMFIVDPTCPVRIYFFNIDFF